jgi:hypothetical protein
LRQSRKPLFHKDLSDENISATMALSSERDTRVSGAGRERIVQVVSATVTAPCRNQ